jgi:hypothetical protein
MNDRNLRIPAEDPPRFGSDSGHLVAEPIGHQVGFLTAGRLESLKSGEESPSSSPDYLILFVAIFVPERVGFGIARSFRCARLCPSP